jgi:hypothetical protein
MTVKKRNEAVPRKRVKVVGAKEDVDRHTLGYLGVCQNQKALNSVLKAAPDTVIKTICNAALNVQRGSDVVLTNKQKQLFRKHGAQINKLVSPQASLKSKRKVLNQQGGAFWIPALIGAAATALGSALFGGKKE